MKINTLHSAFAGVFTAAFLFLAGCNSTQMETSWKAPEVDSIHFTKVLVISTTPGDALRRSEEDAMKKQVTSVPVVASYELLPNAEDQKDRAKMAAAIKAAGVDGIIVMRLVSDAQEVSYTPGSPMPTPYRSFYGYYSRPYALQPYYYDPGTFSTDRVIGIETNIYNAKDETLIWSALTKSTNPGNVDKLVAEVAEVVRAKLRDQKLIP